jgi:shikimate dehydrogenase
MNCGEREGRVTSGEAMLCGIIGDPIEHTMSPVMHNTAFSKLRLNYRYVPFRVKKEELGKAIERMRALKMRGLNVTIPHKVAVIPFLDELDPLAKEIGAVNTIVNDDGVLTGYNTDAVGFLRALLAKGIEPKGRNVVILGAGGASRAISFVLAKRGCDVLILNRTLYKARELASRVSEACRKEVSALELNRENVTRALGETDILVNTTSVGMSPNVEETPVSADFFSEVKNPTLVVFDIVYNPVRTRLLREAEKAGAKTISGLDMLVWQGALAFEKWTGLDAPLGLMKEEVIKALERHEG